MYIQRTLEEKIRKYLRAPEILAVIGPRQSGKTTLLKEIFKSLKDAVYLDFEDRDVLGLFNKDIKLFYNVYLRQKKYLFIDEFQYAKKGGQKLKYLYDTHKVKMVISGSSVLDLTHQAVKYLVGRIFVFHLFPFSFREYLSHRSPSLYAHVYRGLKKKTEAYLYRGGASAPVVSEVTTREMNRHYREYAVFGGYPRVVLAKKKEEKELILKNIYNTFFLREIRDILQLSSEEELQKLIRALALQVGAAVVFNELGQTASLRYGLLVKHLNILEKTFVIKKVLPFCKNKRVEIVKTPKIYFLDNGFRNIAIGNLQRLEERVDRGCLNENFVAAQLLKEEHPIRYWRTKSNAEVDFFFEEDGGSMAVEVKSTLHASKAGKALLSFQQKYAPRRTVVVSENYSFFDRRRGILFMPLFLI